MYRTFMFVFTLMFIKNPALLYSMHTLYDFGQIWNAVRYKMTML